MSVTITRTPGTTRELLLSRYLDALRSGFYSQSFGSLHSDDGHCALGVADELFGKSGNFWALPRALANDMGLLEPATAEELAEIDYTPSVPSSVPTRQTVIAQLNDKARLSFEEIADRIESFGWDK